jgi:tetracycline resistance efflux pump
MGYGAIALIPPAVVIILAIKQRTSFEPLLIGCLVGYVIIGFHDHTNVFSNFVNSFEGVMGNKDSVWVILVCGLYGSLIGLMVRSGGTFKFGEWALKHLKTERSALMGAWFSG